MSNSKNSGDSGIDSSNQQRKIIQKKTITQLRDEVIEERRRSDAYNDAELLRNVRSSNSDFFETLRGEMRQRFNTGEYGGFSKDDIINANSTSDEKIKEVFERLLLSTSSGQEKLKARVLGMYSNTAFSDKSPEGRENKQNLDTWIGTLNGALIEKYMRRPFLLRKKLGEALGDNRVDAFIPRNKSNFLKRLGIKENALSESEKIACAEIAQGIGTVSEEHVAVYLGIIDSSSVSESEKFQVKKDILREHFPFISPRLLVSLGIVSEQDAKNRVKKGLEKFFGDGYFEQGSDAERKDKADFLGTAYEKGQYIELPIEDFLSDDTFVKKIFSHPKLKEAFYTSIRDAHGEIVSAKWDMGDLKIVPDAHGNWNESFVQNLRSLKKEDGTNRIQGAENFQKNSYICITRRGEKGEEEYGYYRIADIDIEMSMVSHLRDAEGLPVKHHGVQLEDWTSGDGMVKPGQQFSLQKGYVDIWNLFKVPNQEIVIIDEMEMKQKRENKDIKTAYTESDAIASIEELTEALGWEPKTGHIYTTEGIEGGDMYIEIISIDIANNTIKISDGGQGVDLSFNDFYTRLAKPTKLKEVGSSGTDDELSKILQEHLGKIDGFGDFKNLFIEDGQVQQKIKGPDGKEEKVVIHHFINEDGEGVYFDKISARGAEVSFGTVKDGKNKKDWADLKGKVNLGPFKSGTHFSSLAGILNYLREQEYKPYINPKDKPAGPDAEDHMPHTHGSLWGKIMNGTSVSDMMKAFDLYKHAWEHKLEKNSKFQAAKFADNYLRGLMPEGFSYQLRSEAYAAQNEAMEGILKMLEDQMSGKEARLYIRKKILLNDDAKFEEVLAGLLYISKKTGQLYPEELSDLKNSQIWFYKLAVTQGHKSKASRDELRAKCIEKTDKSEMGLDAVSEMDIIERQLKLYEGKGYRIPPNIAPKFPGALNEGKKSNFDKGELEVNQRTNIKQMNKYALSKLNVGEAYKVIGCIDRLHTKNGSATELNAIPFTLLMSNMPEYMGSEFRKELHSKGTGLYASHAFKFGNEMSLVNLYRDTVSIAAKELDRRNGLKGKPTNIAKKLDEIEDKRSHIGDESHDKDTEDPQKKWVNSIFEFWMEYGAELQPLLQMTDPFVFAMAKNGDKTCAAYLERWNIVSGMQNGQVDSLPKSANITEGNMSQDHTPFAFTNLVNAFWNDVYTQDGHLKNLEFSYGKVFKPGILGAFENLKHMDPRDVPPGMTLQDVQYKKFREYYAAMMFYMRPKGNPPEKIVGGDRSNISYSKQPYIKDLEDIGFKIKTTDFRNSSTTVVGSGGQEKSGEFSKTELDSLDEIRCKQMFEEFMNTTSKVSGSVRGSVGSTLSW